MPVNQTIIIIAITCLISFLAFSNKKLQARLIFWSPAIKAGEYHRFMTYGFIHADAGHLLFNMITLFFFGHHIERLYKTTLAGWGYVVFYLVAILVSILPSYYQHKNNAQFASLGASGAVSAVLFAFILLDPWRILLVFFIPMPAIIFAVGYILYSMYANKKNKNNINHTAHLTGAAFGVLFTLIYKPSLLAHFINKLLNPSFLSVH